MRKIAILLIALMVMGVGFLSGCTNVDNQDTTQPSIALFNVEPSMINKGEAANLSWTVTGATTVSIDNGIGDVSLSGTRIIAPIQNATYTLTASNSNTSKTATTQIIVSDKSESDDDDDTTQYKTPSIAMMKDNSKDIIAVTSASTGIYWSDIQVKTDNEGASINGHLVGTAWTVATNLGLSGTIQAGDSMLITGPMGDVEVTMRYPLTNSLIGSWTINV